MAETRRGSRGALKMCRRETACLGKMDEPKTAERPPRRRESTTDARVAHSQDRQEAGGGCWSGSGISEQIQYEHGADSKLLILQ